MNDRQLPSVLQTHWMLTLTVISKYVVSQARTVTDTMLMKYTACQEKEIQILPVTDDCELNLAECEWNLICLKVRLVYSRD